MNVLKPNQRATIITLLQRNTPQREIARITGIDRKTIRSYHQCWLLDPANSPGWPPTLRAWPLKFPHPGHRLCVCDVTSRIYLPIFLKVFLLCQRQKLWQGVQYCPETHSAQIALLSPHTFYATRRGRQGPLVTIFAVHEGSEGWQRVAVLHFWEIPFA